MKIMGQVVGILPLALLVSLPNQLLAHVPITNISSQYTSRLERMEEEMDTSDVEDDEELANSRRLPELGQIFYVGQYIRAVVSAANAPGTNDPSGLSRSRDELARNCRRVELSLVPERVNEGVQKGDLKAGFVRRITSTLQLLPTDHLVADLNGSGKECRGPRIRFGPRCSWCRRIPFLQGIQIQGFRASATSIYWTNRRGDGCQSFHQSEDMHSVKGPLNVQNSISKLPSVYTQSQR